MRVSISEAQAHFSRLVAAAEKGQHIVITRYGLPVACLLPCKPARPRRCGRLAGRPFRYGDGFDDPRLSKRIADDFGVSKGQLPRRSRPQCGGRARGVG
ncbi:MAG: type II toxin-antitoxin system Phd/YefM family antitoxin [Verrucomicrobiota bacterium]